jgi:hypothetical protein
MCICRRKTSCISEIHFYNSSPRTRLFVLIIITYSPSHTYVPYKWYLFNYNFVLNHFLRQSQVSWFKRPNNKRYSQSYATFLRIFMPLYAEILAFALLLYHLWRLTFFTPRPMKVIMLVCNCVCREQTFAGCLLICVIFRTYSSLSRHKNTGFMVRLLKLS